jgi:hypothetical protein
MRARSRSIGPMGPLAYRLTLSFKQLGPLTTRAGGFVEALPGPLLGRLDPLQPIDVLMPLRRRPAGLRRSLAERLHSLPVMNASDHLWHGPGTPAK